jgi:cytochrome c oxidase subunit 3
MNLFQELAKRSWTAEQGALDNLDTGSAYAISAAKVGLRLFLVVVTVVFTLVVVIYTERMEFPDWRSFPEPWLLWLNTAMLVLSSVALHWAMTNARRDRFDRVKAGLVAGGVYTLAFLAGQLLAWKYLVASGFYASDNPAVAFFYLITALHGIHLLGGVVALGRTIVKSWRGTFDKARLLSSIELCTTYWHFLLVVWLVMFALLLFT